MTQSTDIAHTLSRRSLLRGMAGAAAGLAVSPWLTRQTSAAEAGPDSSPAAAVPSNPFFEAAKIETTPLADGLWLLTGPGGNIAVVEGQDGVLLVDCGVPSRAPALVKRVSELCGGKRITTVINTHWHFDHSGGNALLGSSGARIIAHEQTRVRLSTDQQNEALGFLFRASPPAALPVITFDDHSTVYFGNHTLKMTHLPPAHTDTDVAIYFPEANVLHTGDLMFNGMYPFIDWGSKGSIEGMVAAANAMLAFPGVDDKTRFIPGHGPMGNATQLKEFRDMLTEVKARIAPMIKAGKTADEIVAAAPTKDLDAKWGNWLIKPDVFVKLAVGCLTHNS